LEPGGSSAVGHGGAWWCVDLQTLKEWIESTLEHF
jgi:hypothetical protein